MLAQAEKVHAVSPRRMAKSSTKRFNFTVVDDDFEESQRGFVPKEMNADTKKCMKFFKDSASNSTIKMVPNDILLTDTALQLLEVLIHHGVIKPLGGWKAVAFATRTLGILGHSIYVNSSLQPTTRAFNNSNYLRRAAIFGK